MVINTEDLISIMGKRDTWQLTTPTHIVGRMVETWEIVKVSTRIILTRKEWVILNRYMDSRVTPLIFEIHVF